MQKFCVVVPPLVAMTETVAGEPVVQLRSASAAARGVRSGRNQNRVVAGGVAGAGEAVAQSDRRLRRAERRWRTR